jgi:hypothetical protein
MMKVGTTFRKEVESPKANLQKMMEFLAPKPSEVDPTIQLDIPDENATSKANMTQQRVPFFVPYSSERDNLGRLKLLSSRRSTQPDTVGARAPSLPRLQQSIYSNFKDAGVAEPVDLQNPKRFKVVDGFERQINIIVRNKEFMNFLKEEKRNVLS